MVSSSLFVMGDSGLSAVTPILNGVCLTGVCIMAVRSLRRGEAGNLMDFNGDPGEAIDNGREVRVSSVGDGVDPISACWLDPRAREAEAGCYEVRFRLSAGIQTVYRIGRTHIPSLVRDLLLQPFDGLFLCLQPVLGAIKRRLWGIIHLDRLLFRSRSGLGSALFSLSTVRRSTSNRDHLLEKRMLD